MTFAAGLFLGSIFGACLGFVALAVLRFDPRLGCRATCQGLARLRSNFVSGHCAFFLNSGVVRKATEARSP